MGDWCSISKVFALIFRGPEAHYRKETLMATMTGTIKRMVSDKGFGFIAAGDGTEYFFHQSACTSTRFDDMREGQTVSFTVGQGPKGPRAENVQPE
jgi:CspA family cold shock protein